MGSHAAIVAQARWLRYAPPPLTGYMRALKTLCEKGWQPTVGPTEEIDEWMPLGLPRQVRSQVPFRILFMV